MPHIYHFVIHIEPDIAEESTPQKSTTRAKTRDLTFRKASRKRRLCRQLKPWCGEELYDNLHQYSKNRICIPYPRCRIKTKNKGRRRTLYGNYYPSRCPSPKDRRRVDAMNDQEKDQF